MNNNNKSTKNNKMSRKAVSCSKYKPILYPGSGINALLPYYLCRAAGYVSESKVISHAFDEGLPWGRSNYSQSKSKSNSKNTRKNLSNIKKHKLNDIFSRIKCVNSERDKSYNTANKKPNLTYENQKAILETMPRLQPASEQTLDDGCGSGTGWWSRLDIMSSVRPRRELPGRLG